ncbi:MAG: type I glyceraldehyde-3-phosphate dehydrogenase [Alphaproteobacteria bacterium]|nr:type I glyceraldehyde-3-phosphate dehydrogenase [Alphaproteobacteria bacterium]MCB9696191.1 type I glyceraldehyde-3-phosphate dehydrogenase [Alphaproteobacteria bacterium]
MAVRIAINGFGRIGRNVLRAGWGKPEFEFVHINDLTSADMLAYLLRRDSVHGTFPHEVKAVDGGISIDGKVIPVTAEKDPAKLPWGASNVDVVFECTGVFTSRAQLQVHRDAGARKVVLSAPAKSETEVDLTIVMGVNDSDYDGEKHHIVSNASCTTNCLAPVVKALHGAVGIEHGLVTTIHSYTMDQNLLDAPHRKGDFRRARAAAANMVPSSTGAAKAIGLVMPELKGKLNGMSMRVPTTDVSIVDLVFQASRETSKEEINDILSKAAAGPLKGVLAATEEPIVSSDMVGNPNSSIVDLPLTQVMAGNMVKVFSWYDNEWGFSCRMLDLAKRISG